MQCIISIVNIFCCRILSHLLFTKYDVNNSVISKFKIIKFLAHSALFIVLIGTARYLADYVRHSACSFVIYPWVSVYYVVLLCYKVLQKTCGFWRMLEETRNDLNC